MILFRPWQAFLFLGISIVIIVASIPSRKDLGMYYFNSYEYEKAMDYLVEEDKINSGDVFVLKKLKEFALIQGDVNKAYQTQKHLLSLKPKNLEYLLEAEKLADWTNRPHDKVELQEIRGNLLKEKSLEEAHQVLLEVANGYRFLKDFENADRVFLELGKLDEKVYLENAIRYFLARKKAKEAEVLLSKHNQLFPQNLTFNNFYYQTLLYQRDYNSAYRILLKNLFPKKKWEDFGHQEVLASLSRAPKSFVKRNESSFIKILTLNFRIFPENRESDFLEILSSLEGRVQGIGMTLVNFGIEVFKDESGEFGKSLFSRAISNAGAEYREVHLNIAEFYLSKKLYKDALEPIQALTERYPLNRRYWEMLAETYEMLGEKEKAVKAFLKLYKLQKKKSDSVFIWKLDPRYLYVQVGSLDQKAYPKTRKLSPEQIKLLSVEDRLVNSIYSLNDPEEKIKAFEELLEENPGSIQAKKGIAYSYFEVGETEKAKNIFEEIYKGNPNDPDANQVLLPDWVVAKDWAKVENAKRTYPKDAKDYDLTFSDYYYEKDPARYKEFCKTTTNSGAKAECLVRDGKQLEALELVRLENQKAPNECEFYVRRLYLEVDTGDLDWVREQLQKPTPCISDKSKSELENFYYSQNLFRRSGHFWRWEQSVGYMDTNQFALGMADFSLMRKMKSWALHTEANLNRILWRGDSTFTQLNVGGTYFFKNGSGLSAGPTYTFGDKLEKAGVFARYFMNLTSLFINFEYQSKKPLNQTRTLAIEENSFSNGLEVYMNYRPPSREYTFIGSTQFQEITLRNEKALYSQITVEGLKRFFTNKKKKPLELSAGLQLSNSNLSSAALSEVLIRENFVSKSLAYHAVLKAEYNYPDFFIPRKWSGFLRLGIGGDSKRNIDFSKSTQIMGQVNKAISKRAKVFLSGEYYSENIGVNRGETKVYRLGILQDF